MLRRRPHLAIGFIWLVSSLVIALVTVGLSAGSSSAASRRDNVRTVLAGTGPDLTTPLVFSIDPTTSSSSTTSSTTPTTAAPTTAPTPAPTTPPTTARTVPKVTTTAPRPAAVTTPPTTAPAARRAAGGDTSDFTLEGYRWNPCKMITVNSTGPDIAGIVSELASITGLRLQMVSGPAEINVQWGSVPAGGEIGVTVWEAIGPWLASSSINISPQAQPYLATVLRHELGHALGLGHAPRPGEVMYPTVGTTSPTDYQAGDLAGLHAVGASNGC